MGAYSWSRDKSGAGKTHVAGAPVVLPPPAAKGGPPPAKKLRVWKREDAQAGAERPGSSPAAGPASEGSAQRPAPQQQPAAGAERPVAQPGDRPSLPSPQQQQQQQQQQQRAQHQQPPLEAQDAELEALRRKIAEKQAALQQAAAGSRRTAAEAAERSRQKQERRQRLEAGFAKAFAEAKAAAAEEIAAGRAPVAFADEREVQRVLGAKSDYDVLRLQPGADAAAVRRRYREMAVTLHPDKCRAAQASDAFQRLVRAYQSLLQFAR